jgi:tetraacyldisaccharide 4'-kinase
MREYIHSIMLDRNRSFAARPIKVFLLLASGVYLLLFHIRLILYTRRLFRQRRVPAKVISVGNLTLGGTGKTPFTAMLAVLVKDRFSRSPAVLIRGYGWDEQAMLKGCLKDIPVLVGPDRVKNSREAIEKFGADTIILDDGFQHWRLARDLDILLIDTRNPFGNGMLFPRGILREPVSSVRRADVVVFTKTDRPKVDINGMVARLKSIKKDLVFLEAEHRAACLWDLKTREPFPLERMRQARAYLVSSIGDPDYFEWTVTCLGAKAVGHARYPDHHTYLGSDAARISKEAQGSDLIVTTEKDAVKFSSSHLISDIQQPVFVLGIRMAITKGEEQLLARLDSLYSG